MNDELKRALRTAIIDVLEAGDKNYGRRRVSEHGWSFWSDMEGFATRQRNAFVDQVIARMEELNPPQSLLRCCAFHRSGGRLSYPCSSFIYRGT